MKPFRAIVTRSTVRELRLQLSNGHSVTTTPYPDLHFGQAVLVGYDFTKNRVGEVHTELPEEMAEDMIESDAPASGFDESVVEGEDGGSVN